MRTGSINGVFRANVAETSILFDTDCHAVSVRKPNTAGAQS